MKKKLTMLTIAVLCVLNVASAQMKIAVTDFKAEAGIEQGDVDGILINGIKWATRNVGSPGTFVANPEDYGNYYTFDEAQSACPAGWRTPTKSEFERLVAASSQRSSVNGVKGRIFGTGSNTIFIPYSGYRNNYYGGDFSHVGIDGSYWSSVPRRNRGFCLDFANTYVTTSSIYNRAAGLPVRCVQE